jgi:hypothetical protein
MYCDDSRGTDIDHFEPLDRAPLRAFEWPNHLLACSYCNSNAKREQYPVDRVTGACLLVDPTADDPADHLELLLSTGAYAAVANSAKGEATIEVFGLNRPELVKGRQDAFVKARSILRDWHHLCGREEHEAVQEAARLAQALVDSPFADVVHAMIRLRPGVARIVVGPLTLPALDAWKRRTGPETGGGSSPVAPAHSARPAPARPAPA